MTSPTIRPARGLWAAVSPEGTIHASTVRDNADSTSTMAWMVTGEPWPALAAIGWRIIRVDVIPHEEGKDAETRADE